MLVYRVEHEKDGIGPYETNLFVSIDYSNPIPSWSSDNITDQIHKANMNVRMFYAAFPDEENLKDTLGPILRILHDNNFNLKIYDVSNTSYFKGNSGRQLAFLRSNAKLVETRLLVKQEIARGIVSYKTTEMMFF